VTSNCKRLGDFAGPFFFGRERTSELAVTGISRNKTQPFAPAIPSTIFASARIYAGLSPRRSDARPQIAETGTLKMKNPRNHWIPRVR
jgi:hypothetical protein